MQKFSHYLNNSSTQAALSGPINIYPSQSLTYTMTDWDAFSTYTVTATTGTVSMSGDQLTYVSPATAGTAIITISAGSFVRRLEVTILPFGVATPINITPTNNSVNQDGTVTLTASAFIYLGQTDTHLNSDWQVATDASFSTVISSSMASTSNKTNYIVSGLSVNQTYYWRVRYRGTANGVSAYSTPFAFTTKSSFGGLIGTPGAQGFGVGVFPNALPSGFSALPGYNDPSNGNYGNYQYSDGSIMVFVPAFYYRIGSTSAPLYSTYGANTLEIANINAYASESLANAAGFVLHRAFVDGGLTKAGFFFDKYLASKNGSNSCKSIAGAAPISLTSDTTTYIASANMTGCSGIFADSVVLARSRGVGIFNVPSVFMYSAIAMLSLAHAQASSSTANCAWYDSTYNFPKGCNNALADVNDPYVTYTQATGETNTKKPNTGSGTPFAKTTHNGQANGICDINGCIWQTALGITGAGTGATDSANIPSGDIYVLKHTATLASLTAGFGGSTDAWGTSSSLVSNYDLISGAMPSPTGVTLWLGNGTNQVFSADVSTSNASASTAKTNYLRTCAGIPLVSGTNSTGTNLFGQDYVFVCDITNMFPCQAGGWNNGSSTGVFNCNWSGYRSNSSANCGFRASAYL